VKIVYDVPKGFPSRESLAIWASIWSNITGRLKLGGEGRRRGSWGGGPRANCLAKQVGNEEDVGVCAAKRFPQPPRRRKTLTRPEKGLSLKSSGEREREKRKKENIKRRRRRKADAQL